MNQDYIIGLDLGVNNVGWAIINPENKKIEKAGVRLYTASDAAQDRRISRNTRRRLKRRDNRLKDNLRLFKSIGFPEKISIETKMLEKRIRGLTQKLEPQEIVNVVAYYMTHRGYIPFGDEDRKLVELNGKLPCEYYQELYQKTGKYRALEEVVNHKELVEELKKLLKTQQTFYPELESIIGSYEEKSGLLWIFSRKRQFWEGPGSKNSFTPYGRFKNEIDVENYNQLKSQGKEKFLFEDLIGKCSIYPHEKSAPKTNFFAEEFNLLNDFINIRIINGENIKSQKYIEQTPSKDYKLTTAALEDIIDYCLNNVSVTYPKVLKEVLGLTKKDILGYRIKKDGSPEFSLMNTYRYVIGLYKANNIDYEWLINNDYKNYNELMNILIVVPGVVEAKKMLENIHKIEGEEELVLTKIYAKISKEKYHSLSQKALKRAIKDMKSECLNFMQVSKKYDYEKEAREEKIENYGSGEGFLHMTTQYVDDLIASPQVKKTLRQAIRIINAIIQQKKSYPSVIAIESAKEMNGEEARKEIEKEQKLNEKLRLEATALLETTYGEDKITPNMVERVMLYNEMNGACPYCGTPISLNDVLNNTVEVEHILPISQSANDSFQNKTLACRKCNANKGNKTPFNFLNSEEFEEFTTRVNNMKISQNKKNNFLTQEDLNKYQTRFFNRNLRDTSYATKELVNQVKLFNEYLKAYTSDIEIKTLSTPGQLTHKIRRRWDLEKNRDDGKFHHAVDASIVASIATSKIGELIIESQNNAQFWIVNKNKASKIPEYLKNFSLKEWKGEISNIDNDDKINISMQVNKDPNRSFSNANITSFIQKENKNYYKILQISDIYSADLMKNNKKTLDILFNPNNDKLTLLCQETDSKLFNYLKDIYNTYQIDNKNPFVQYCLENNDEIETEKEFNYLLHGIKTPSKNNKGVLVKKLRYMQQVSKPYLLEKQNVKKKENTLIGLDSVSVYCTRLYWDKELKKILFLPIYCPCVNLKTKKINEEHPLYKSYYNEVIADKEVEFIVDLFNGDYVEVEKQNGDLIKEYIKGYAKVSKSIQTKSGAYLSPKDTFTLYDVDVLGNKKKRLTWPEK